MIQLPLWQHAENSRGAKCTINNTNNMVPVCLGTPRDNREIRASGKQTG